MERIPASERTREKLKALMEGCSEVEDGRSELVRLAARLIIEEALEGEARDVLGRGYYARGAASRRRVSQRIPNGPSAERGGRHRLQRAADRRPQRAVPLAHPGGGAGRYGGAGGPGSGDVCARAFDARHRGAVCRQGWPQPAEPHRGERDHRAAVGGVRGVCDPRSGGVRDHLPVCRRDCRAAAPGPAARGGAGGLGHPGGWQKGAVAPGAGDQGGHRELQGILS